MMLTANLGCLSLLFVSGKFDGIIVIHSYLIKFKCLSVQFMLRPRAGPVIDDPHQAV